MNNLEIFYKWGYDSSSEQSQYKINFHQSSLFLNRYWLWPFHISFSTSTITIFNELNNETKESIIEEVENIKIQINNLTDTNIMYSGTQIQYKAGQVNDFLTR